MMLCPQLSYIGTQAMKTRINGWGSTSSSFQLASQLSRLSVTRNSEGDFSRDKRVHWQAVHLGDLKAAQIMRARAHRLTHAYHDHLWNDSRVEILFRLRGMAKMSRDWSWIPLPTGSQQW